MIWSRNWSALAGDESLHNNGLCKSRDRVFQVAQTSIPSGPFKDQRSGMRREIVRSKQTRDVLTRLLDNQTVRMWVSRLHTTVFLLCRVLTRVRLDMSSGRSSSVASRHMNDYILNHSCFYFFIFFIFFNASSVWFCCKKIHGASVNHE